MNSTVQQTAYLLPTARRTPHPSQVPFDPTISLKVKSMSSKNSRANSNWTYNYGRSCWTADVSRPHHHHQIQGSRQTIIQSQPGYRRPYTTFDPDSDCWLTTPATAALPRRGQVKLISINHEQTTPKSSKTKTAGAKAHRVQHLGNLDRIPAARNMNLTSRGNVGNVTVADLQSVIDTEFPETQGLAFNKASHYIRTATADLIKAHSRSPSQVSTARRENIPKIRPGSLKQKEQPANSNPLGNIKRKGSPEPTKGSDVTQPTPTKTAGESNVHTTTPVDVTPENNAVGIVNIHVPTS